MELHSAALEEQSIPLGKVVARLTRLLEEDPEGSCIPVVLLSTGSFAPVHRMHYQVFEVAKQWLESRYSFSVVGGFLSPSHDDYVGAKMRKSGAGHIEASHRLAMCRLLVEQEHRSDWVAVSSWEVNSPQGFHDFPVVARYHNQHLRERLSALLGEKEDQKPLLKLVSRLRLFYLCGADHASNCFFFIKGGIPALPQIGIVAVGRPGYTEQLKRFSQISARREGGGGGKGQEEETLHFILVESEMQDTSSTLIRKRLAAGQSIADLTGSAVADYIESNDLRKLFAYLP